MNDPPVEFHEDVRTYDSDNITANHYKSPSNYVLLSDSDIVAVNMVLQITIPIVDRHISPYRRALVAKHHVNQGVETADLV